MYLDERKTSAQKHHHNYQHYYYSYATTSVGFKMIPDFDQDLIFLTAHNKTLQAIVSNCCCITCNLTVLNKFAQ